MIGALSQYAQFLLYQNQIHYQYRNFPKFSDRQVWANGADPDQTVCHSVCIVWTHYSMVEPHSSNFRVITTNFFGVRIFRKFAVLCFITLFENLCDLKAKQDTYFAFSFFNFSVLQHFCYQIM